MAKPYNYRYKSINRPDNPINALLNKSIQELQENSKAVEEALESILKQDGVEISAKEYTEIKQLTDTMNALDSVILSVEEKDAKRANKKPVKKKKTVGRKRKRK